MSDPNLTTVKAVYPGEIQSPETIQEWFENVCLATPLWSVLSLKRDEKGRYVDGDTRARWEGFRLGVRCLERIIGESCK